MIYYYGLFALAAILGIPFLFEKNSKPYSIYFRISDRWGKGISYKQLYVMFMLTLVALLVGLRAHDVGLDTARYISSRYESGPIVLFEEDWEIVMDIIAIIAQVFTDDSQLFLLLNGILIAVLFGKFIYDNTDHVGVAFLVFIGMFFVQSMNLMREWLAIGFGLNAYTFYSRKQTKKAILLLFLAVLTHLTAIVLLFIPLFDRFKNKKIALALTVAGSVALVVFQRPILSVMVSIFPQYTSYIDRNRFLNENAFNIKNLIYIAILCYILFISFCTRDKNEREQYWTYAAYMTLAIAFSLCGGTFQMMHRLAYYYSVFLIIIMPQTIQKTWLRIFIKPLLIAAMFIMLMRSGVSDNNGISEYAFFWQ